MTSKTVPNPRNYQHLPVPGTAGNYQQPKNAKPQVKPPFSQFPKCGNCPELRELPLVPSSHTLCGNWERPPRKRGSVNT
jgi:hypothetical protein